MEPTRIGKMTRQETRIKRQLERLAVMFIDFAELRALNQKVITMKDWLVYVEKFLNYTDQKSLPSAGQISHDKAEAKVHTACSCD